MRSGSSGGARSRLVGCACSGVKQALQGCARAKNRRDGWRVGGSDLKVTATDVSFIVERTNRRRSAQEVSGLHGPRTVLHLTTTQGQARSDQL